MSQYQTPTPHDPYQQAASGPPAQYLPPQQPYEAATQQQFSPTPQGPPPRRNWLPWTIAAVAIVALAVVAAVAFVGAVGVSSVARELSEEVAQRECRTALEQEATRRANNVGSIGSTSVLTTVKRIDLQETYERDGGWTVNGTVTYTLTTGLLPQVEQSVSLTCNATGTDDAVQTTVTNRG